LSLHGPHIDPQLERHFKGFNPEPPQGAWDRIAASLDHQKRRRRWLWWSSSAAALLVVGSLLFVIYGTPQTQIREQTGTAEAQASQTADRKGAVLPAIPEPKHQETPIRASESFTHHHPGQKPASPSTVQNDVQFPAEAAVYSVPLPQGFGMSGKGIEMLPFQDVHPEQASAVFCLEQPRHRQRVAAPAVELGLVLNPSVQNLNLRLASAWANYVHEDYLGIRRNQESPLEALQGGVDIAVRIRGGWRFNSGLWFTEQGTRQQYNYAINKLPAYRGGTSDLFGNRLIEGYFIDPTPETVRYAGTVRIQMVQIPLQAGYERRIGIRGGLLLQTGIAASLLFSSEGMNINYSNLQLDVANSNQLRQTQWTALGSLSYMHNLSKFIRAGLGVRRAQSIANQYRTGAPLIGSGDNTGIQFNLHYRIY
jgi:hypothetical protein